MSLNTHNLSVPVNVSFCQFWTYCSLALKCPGFLLPCKIITDSPIWHKWSSLMHKQSLWDFLQCNPTIMYVAHHGSMRDVCVLKKWMFLVFLSDLIITDTLSVQFSSVAQSCPTLCDPMNRSTPGLPVHHQLLEFTQTHVHRVSDSIQPSHLLSSPSPPAPNPSQHQSFPVSQLVAWGGQSPGVSALASVLPKNTQDWSPLQKVIILIN